MSTATEDRMVTRARGGSAERKVKLADIKIPDVWHIAQAQKTPEAKEAILEVWHLAHDLRKELLWGKPANRKGSI